MGEAGSLVSALENSNRTQSRSALVRATGGTSDSQRTLYTFTSGNDGGTPAGTLLTDVSGNIYGACAAGGQGGAGTLYQLTAAGVLNVLHAFQGNGDGVSPGAGLIQGSDGNFYGTT